ncbi:MAG: tetratricopeptide repeat protein [bacterium]
MINPMLTSLTQYGTAKKDFSEFLNRYENKRDIPTVAALCKKSYLYLAQIANLQGDYSDAISWYKRGLTFFPDDSKFKIEANLALAKTHQQLLELQLAAQAYQNAITQDEFNEFLKSHPQLMALPLNVARLQQLSSTNGLALVSYRQAESYYHKIVEEKSGSELAFWAMIQLANSYADQKQWEKCLTTLKTATSLYPNHQTIPEILLFVGTIYSDVKHEYLTAKSYYEKAFHESDISSVHAKAQLELGALRFKQKQNEEARKKMRWVIEEYPREGRIGAMAQLAVAHSYEQEGRWDRALVEFRWLMDTYPITPEGVYAPLHIANHFKTLGEDDMAANAFTDASERYFELISKYPQSQLSAMAQQYLAICYALSEKWEHALNAAEQLYEKYQTTPQIAMGSQILLGQLYEKNGKIDAALQIYKDFLNKFSGHPLANQVRSRITQLTGGNFKH